MAAATAPAPLILAAFRSPALATEAKADGTPVTAADREAEAAIRAALRRAGEWGQLEILGEEGGAEGEPGPLRWIIDPIDGTRAFARGLPTFGTIVALEETGSGRALLGVIHLPAAGETLAAARGLGARRGATALRASRAADLRDAIVSVPDLAEFRAAGLAEGYHRLHRLCDRVRGYTDCWAHAQVVAGAVDALVDPGLRPWDVRATQVLVEEAGGVHLTRASAIPGCEDIVCGSPALVEQLARVFGF